MHPPPAPYPDTFKCSIETPVHGPAVVHMSIMSPLEKPVEARRLVSGPSPMIRVLLGKIHGTERLSTDAGSSTVDGTLTSVPTPPVPWNGLTLQACPPTPGAPLGTTATIPRASMTAPVAG